MTAVDFITELFCPIDEKIDDNQKQAVSQRGGDAGLTVCPQWQRTTSLLALVDPRLPALVSQAASSDPFVSLV